MLFNSLNLRFSFRSVHAILVERGVSFKLLLLRRVISLCVLGLRFLFLLFFDGG